MRSGRAACLWLRTATWGLFFLRDAPCWLGTQLLFPRASWQSTWACRVHTDSGLLSRAPRLSLGSPGVVRKIWGPWARPPACFGS